jgi:hypothetical protein
MEQTDHPNTIRVVIDLAAGVGPIEGELVEPHAHASRFRGWLSLTALIEAARTNKSSGSLPDARPGDADDAGGAAATTAKPT